jgi:UDP-N-acetyl-D-glucosamine dehydrogenase
VNANGAPVRSRLYEGPALVGVIGLGYVGLPLAVEIANSGYQVVGLDISPDVVAGVNAGVSHVQDVPSAVLFAHVRSGRLRATLDAAELSKCDAISICVPTPLNKIKDPDLSFVIAAGVTIRDQLQPGQLIIREHHISGHDTRSPAARSRAKWSPAG